MASSAWVLCCKSSTYLRIFEYLSHGYFVKPKIKIVVYLFGETVFRPDIAIFFHRIVLLDFFL